MNNSNAKVQQKKRFILVELIAGVLLLILILHLLTELFQYRELGSGGGFVNFYSLDQNSLDVMTFGSSHAGCTIDEVKLWKDDGIAGYSLTAGGQEIESTYFFIREALKTQKPKVIFVETSLVNRSEGEKTGTLTYDLAGLYRTDLGMKWSLSYCQMVLEQSRLYGLNFVQTADLMFKLPITHARYAELQQSDYQNLTPYNVGYIGSYDTGSFEEPELTDQTAEINPISLSYIDKICSLCKEKDVDVIFFHAPYITSEEECAVQNTLEAYLKDKGVPYFNFQKMKDEIGLDYSTDLRSDAVHLNNSGADKVTAWLEKYLETNYNLPDHRGDDRYARWDLSAHWMDVRKDQDTLSKPQDINEYLQTLAAVYQNYDVILTLSGNYNVHAEFDDTTLQGLGINEQSFEQGGTFVIEKGTFTYYSGEEKTYTYNSAFGSEPVTIYRKAPAEFATVDENGSTIGLNTNDGMYIGETNYAHVINGINLVVYDPDLKLVVDHVSTDVYTGIELIRE